MLYNKKNIFKYLNNANVSLEHKDKIINKNLKLIKKYINNLSGEEMVDYLFNPSIPNSLKEIISHEIDSLKYGFDEQSDKKLISITTYIKKFDNLFNEKNLYEPMYPNELKSIIIDKIYDKYDLKELILNKKISFELKKIIIDVKYDSINSIELLYNDMDEQLIDYIIHYKLNTVTGITRSLRDSIISGKIKEAIIKDNIKIKNIFEVMNSYYITDSIRKSIINTKSDDINKYINDLNYKNIVSSIYKYKFSSEIVDIILEKKNNELIKNIKRLSMEDISRYLKNINNEKIIELIIKYHPYKLKMIINRIYSYEIMGWINNKHVPNDIKKYIISKKSKELNKALSNLGISEIFLYYLRENSGLPISIQERILNENKSQILNNINKYTELELYGILSYGSECILLKKLIIEQRINEDNIINVLNRCFYNSDMVELIINQKKEIIKNYLYNLNITELITLSKLDDKAVANKLIDYNRDLVIELLNKRDKNELSSYLNNRKVLKNIKYIILKGIGINKSEMENYLALIKYNDYNLVINNYDNIKKFVEMVNINFNSFIQYGCGTNKYKNWLTNIMKILNNNVQEDFLKVKNYLFNNFYIEDINKENKVYIISDFLEILDNFFNNYNLLINLVNNNTKLSNQDKLNISFLFKSKIKSDNLVNIKNARIALYDKYKKVLDSSVVDIKYLKEIFNNYIFFNSKKCLDSIGGTTSLIMLKKNNCRSKVMCTLIDELILYSKIVEMVNNTENINCLKRLLKYILDKKLIEIQNIFLEFENKVLNVYELDSKLNLTHISYSDSIVSSELSKRYGGNVFNLSDKNYVLYAHVLSSRENMEDLLNGKSTGDSNFISASPISYLGQTYYYDLANMILAFDSIPRGSFICSSINNMGSNGVIESNSSEVNNISKIQRGILETSAVTSNNSEALLYREGLKPCGIILPNKKLPTDKELYFHKKYNLPFILTQPLKTAIDNPENIFSIDDSFIKIDKTYINELNSILDLLTNSLEFNKESDKYTGREIAIISDCHSMYEPTLSVLEEIRKRGIKEIYSLGDNVGLGPDPDYVFDMLEDYKVKSVSGNSEYYNTLGIEPFTYFDDKKTANQVWTYNKLGSSRISKMKLYLPSIDIIVGNKKIGLCHFANDVRWDFIKNSTWTYQTKFVNGNASKQFLYTNSNEALSQIKKTINTNFDSKFIKGYVSALEKPIFNGKLVTDYDCIIQGHVHFDIRDKLNNTDIYTLRAVGMGYSYNDKTDQACYYILKEKKDGTFDIEKQLVSFNKNSLLANVKSSGLPYKEKILSFL